MDFRDRCRVAEKCLPDAPYKEALKALHDEMLSEIERALQLERSVRRRTMKKTKWFPRNVRPAGVAP